MKVSIAKVILASVTTRREERIIGMPVFYADSEEEMVQMATVLSRILEAVAHDMGNDVYIIVKH